MKNDNADILSEAYLIKTQSTIRKGIVILSNGESVEVPVQQLTLFNIPDFFLN